MKSVLLLLTLLLLTSAELRSRRQLRALGRPLQSWRRLLPDLAALAALALLLWPTPAALPGPAAAGPALALAVDVSTSMAAQDVSPNRLERARGEIRALLEGLPQARFALLPFAGEAIVQVPLTADRDALRFFADRLAPGSVTAPGSAPEEAVLTALQTLSGAEGKRAVVLFSDGERTIPEPVPPLPSGIPVFVVPLGTEPGAALLNEGGEPRRSTEGQPLRTRLDKERLRRIAAMTGGKLLEVGTRPAVSPLLERWAPLERRPAGPGANTTAALAVLLLALRHLPFQRRRWRAAAALSLALLLLPLAACDRGETAQGRELFAEAARRQRAGDTASATELFARAAAGMEGEERGAALYNRGTLLLAEGDPDGALPALEEALLLCPGDGAVRSNLALALRALGSERTPGVGSGAGQESSAGDGGMSREQALRLLESVRPDPEAARATRATVRSKRVERDW